MKKRLYTTLLVSTYFLSNLSAYGQGQAVNTTGATAHASAIMDISSTSKGVLIPRMTAAQKTAIASPATGLMIYQTDATAGFYYYDGTAWNAVGGALSGTAGGDLTGSYPNPTIASTAGADVVSAINASSATINDTRLQSTVTTEGNTFNGAAELVKLDGGGRLPAIDGSQLTGIPYWSTAGNTVLTTPKLGTASANPFDVVTGGIVRGRVESTGRLLWGTTTPTVSSVFTNIVGTTALPDAVAAYTPGAGSALWGTTQASSASNFSTVEGDYSGSGTGSGVNGNYNGSSTTGGYGVLGVYNGTSSITGGAGVVGNNNKTSGNARVGVYGTYNGTAYGCALEGIGFGGTTLPATNVDYGIYATAGTTGYAGYFVGAQTATGTKSASVGTSKGNQLLYVTESPEIWFEDLGSGQLVNGKASIDLDPLFLETVLIDAKHPMHVFIQVQGECNDVYVVPGTTGFHVVEKSSGTSNVTFSYRVMAKRLHYADHRFGCDVTWGNEDTRQNTRDVAPRPVNYNEAAAALEKEKKNPANNNTGQTTPMGGMRERGGR